MLSAGLIDRDLANELSALYEIRCQYLHSSSLNNLEADALRCVRGAYAFLKQIIGFPEHLFAINGGAVECLDTDNPLFAHTDDGELVRIISAREVTHGERKSYEES